MQRERDKSLHREVNGVIDDREKHRDIDEERL